MEGLIVAYITQSELESKVPPARIVEALDDNGDGAQDTGAWENLLAAVQRKIDGIMGARFTVPFSPVPNAIAAAALDMAAAELFRRRGIPDEQNPWAKPARDAEARLVSMAAGKEPLEATRQQQVSPIRIVEEDSRLYSESGSLMV